MIHSTRSSGQPLHITRMFHKLQIPAASGVRRGGDWFKSCLCGQYTQPQVVFVDQSCYNVIRELMLFGLARVELEVDGVAI